MSSALATDLAADVQLGQFGRQLRGHGPRKPVAVHAHFQQVGRQVARHIALEVVGVGVERLELDEGAQGREGAREPVVAQREVLEVHEVAQVRHGALEFVARDVERVQSCGG